MRTSIRRWLASVGIAVGAGLSGVHAQTPPKPMPAAQKGAEEIKPTITPKSNAELLPPIIPLTEPVGVPATPCDTCPDVNPNCADPGCAGALIPGPKEAVWMSYTQLLLWFQPARSPFPLAVGGPVGVPATVLLDGERELGKFMAYKIDGGMWTNKDHTVGVGFDGFITEHRSNFLTVAGGPGGNSIRRPFFDVVTGQQTFLFVANADPAAGDVFVGEAATTVTARLASAGAHLRRNLRYDDKYQFDLFAGFRYYDLDESLVVFQRTVSPFAIPAVGVAPGGVVQLRDRAYTRNQFYGGELGGRFEVKHGMTFVALTPKVAFGSIHQITQISGETRGTSTQPGALLAAGDGANGNLGRHVVNRFGLATDIGLQAGVALTKNSRIAVGYQFYYLNNVARPGNQFDQTLNPRNVPVSPSFGSLTGVAAPRVTFDREGFFAHGAAITMEARY
jgi:hypothetical protein